MESISNRGLARAEAVVHLIGWLHDGTRFSARTLLCPRLIRGIYPMLWRRFLVRSDSTLADLHVVLQIGFDWTDFHLHRFRIRKRTTRATPWRARLPRCTGNQADGLALSHQAFADALVLFTDPRGRAASELRLTASRMSVRCHVSPPPK